ncbi:hypothetical protein [Streptomyces sp. NPDC002463]
MGAVVRPHAPDLARTLGLDVTVPLTRRTGAESSRLLATGWTPEAGG